MASMSDHGTKPIVSRLQTTKRFYEALAGMRVSRTLRIITWASSAMRASMTGIGTVFLVSESAQRRRLPSSGANESNVTATAKIPKDCIEIRVHRIEHRKWTSVESCFSTEARAIEYPDADGFWQVLSLHGELLTNIRLSLISGGLVDPRNIQRRYKYQLLDPINEPCTTLSSYYRS